MWVAKLKTVYHLLTYLTYCSVCIILCYHINIHIYTQGWQVILLAANPLWYILQYLLIKCLLRGGGWYLGITGLVNVHDRSSITKFERY